MKADSWSFTFEQDESMTIERVKVIAERLGIPGPDTDEHPDDYNGNCLHYPPSSPADRQAETERVIANVRATIAPAEQAQALRDLMVGADGEPQLDEDMLEDAAEEADEDAREAAAGDGLVYLRKIADESLVLSGTWDATASRHFRTCAPFVIALVEAVSSEIMIDAYRKRDQHRRERKGCDCDWCNVANAHERLFFFVETAMAENAPLRIDPAEQVREAAITARVRETERNLRTAGAEALRRQVVDHLEAQAAREEGESALAAHVLRTAAATVRGMVVGEGSEGGSERGGSDAKACEQGAGICTGCERVLSAREAMLGGGDGLCADCEAADEDGGSDA